MGVRTRINVAGRTLARMDRTDLWVGGYHAPMVSAFTGDVDITEENTPVYGYDGTIDTRVINGGTLNMTGYDHETAMRQVLDVLSNIDPNSAGLRGYKPTGVFTTDVVRNTKHPRRSHYIKGEFFGGWNTVLRPAQGDPKAAGSRTLDGRCAAPLEFAVKDTEQEWVAVAFDIAPMVSGTGGNVVTGNLVSHNGAGSLTEIPEDVPDIGGKYGLAVEVQQRDGTNKILKAAHLSVTQSMVTSAGLITVTLNDLQGTAFTTLAEVTHAHVYFLKSGSTPTGTILLADGIVVRGRFDTTSA
jgi:hypothetical protein